MDAPRARRPVGPNTELVRTVLDRLAAAGVDWAPRFLAVEAGHEVLTWLPGAPADDWWAQPDRLDRLSRIVRRLHDLTAGTVGGGESAVHDDLQPRNVVVAVDGRLGLIDWEQLRPGRRAEDVAQLCWSFTGPAPGEAVEVVARRWRRVLAVYGLDDPSSVVSIARAKIERCLYEMTGQAAAGSARHQALVQRGDDRRLRVVRDWLDEHAVALTAALAGPAPA